MKTAICIAICVLCATTKIRAQAAEIEQLLLNVEKLAQLKQVLSDMKKSYEVLYKGYAAVQNIAEGNFNLHETFINGLLEVSPTVKKYRRVVDILTMQQQLLKEYKSAYLSVKASGTFSLQEIANVLTTGTYRMIDDQRITKIDEIYTALQDQLSFLGDFNAKNQLLILSRKKEQKDINTLRALQ
jgi:predicted DNA-binding protein YlxM (UPF0122 family)